VKNILKNKRQIKENGRILKRNWKLVNLEMGACKEEIQDERGAREGHFWAGSPGEELRE